MPTRSIAARATGLGSRLAAPITFSDKGLPCASMPTASMTRIGSAPLGEVLERVGDLVHVAHVDHVGTPRPGEGEAVVDEVDRDDATHPAVQRAAHGELADRARARARRGCRCR